MKRLALTIAAALLVLGLVPMSAGAAEKGQFQVRCFSSHMASHDPIVAPRMMSAHEHEFFGNVTTNKDSTLASMKAGASNCSASADTAGYWTPTVFNANGSRIQAVSMLVYYRGSFAGEHVRPFPQDLRMVSHDFSLGVKNNFTLRVKFPSCWDGEHLDSADHISHMAYPRNGCPASHPIAVPRITEIFRYESAVTNGHLSSGSYATGHADFWSTWQQQGQAALVDRCLNATRNCGRIDT